jgi:hypothetical protein
MRVAILVKDNDLSSYPCDILIEGEILKSYNLEFELEAKRVDLLIGKGLPSLLIKKLRDKGITFLKVSSLEEIKELDFDISFFKENRIKRGLGCQLRFKS